MTVAKKPGSCSSSFLPGPSHSGAEPPGPAPTPLLYPFPGREGCWGGGGQSWGQLAGGHASAGLKVTRECVWPKLTLAPAFSVTLSKSPPLWPPPSSVSRCPLYL